MQTAADHAHGTAELAEGFAGAFGFAAEGSAAGLHHDDGKYAPKFQARLNGASETYEYSSAGTPDFKIYLAAARPCGRRASFSPP